MKPLRPPPVALLDKYQGEDFERLYVTTVSVAGTSIVVLTDLKEPT